MSHGYPTDTGVDTVHTTFGRTNGRQILPEAPENSESRPKNLERISRRSCRHHNAGA